MRTKPNAADSLSKEDMKYAELIDESLRELKQLQKKILRERAKTARLRASSKKLREDTRATLRRVEANL